MDRKILHCDMNSFFASVELLDHPELRDVPVAVAGDPEHRHGIILAKNEPAKRFGIVTAETIQSAMRKCPSLTLLAPHHDKYEFFYEKINDIYLQYTDMVEPFSIDESWLDVTASEHLFGDAEHIADEIRGRIHDTLGLTCSVGVSYNKIFAKMGSEYRKPDATTLIDRDNYKEILWPLDVGKFFFVGNATATRLRSIGIKTIGDLAGSDPATLERFFGSHGMELRQYANGMDSDPVKRFGERADLKSVGHGITFRRDISGADDISLAVTELSDRVSARLRRHKLKANGVKVELTDPSFVKISRQKRLPSPINTAADIRKAALALIRDAGYSQRPIRLLTITGIDLRREGEGEQLTIFSIPTDDKAQNIPSDRDEKIERTMDAIREKYGTSSIKFAHVIDNDLGIGDTDRKEKNR